MIEKPPWFKPMSDTVRHKVRLWHNGYEQGIHHKPRKVVPPDRGEDGAFVVVPAYKHIIPFRLNEIRWLEKVLAYATQHLPEVSPKRVVAMTICKAREQHEQLQDRGRIAETADYGQEYLFDKTHVHWMLTILGQHMLGRLQIEVDEKQAAKDIEKADW